MWYEIIYRVLSILNYVAIVLFGVPLLLQIIEVLVSLFHKKVKFPKSDKKARIAYLIPARNEEDVIFDSVDDLIKTQKYPRELFDVYVVANNCTDETAERAKKAGAIVLILDDPDPAHHMAAYPLKYGVDYILKNDPTAELIIHLDADNHINHEFSSFMNDAYQSGVDFARPYEGGLNGTQNFFTKACAYFYAFDSRFGGRGKEVMRLSAHVNGAGATMSRRMLLETGGYDCHTISDDTEFSFNRILEGRKAHMVEEAVVYEDMPSSGAVTAGRNARIAKGNKILFKTKTIKILLLVFKTGNFSYLETFLTYIWIFIGGPMFIWFAAYYVYFFLFAGFAMNGALELKMFSEAYFSSVLWNTVWAMIGIAGTLYFLFGIVQVLIFALKEYDKFGAKSRWEFIPMVLLFPVYLIVYGFSMMAPPPKKKGWVKVKRNVISSPSKEKQQ